MKKLHRCLLGCAITSVLGLASAQTMKPGLWEITSKNTGGSPEITKGMAEAQKSLESMPAEQRKMMEDMMAKKGITMGKPGSGMSASMKMCMTKDMIDRNELGAQQGNCTRTSSQRSANTLKFKVECSNPPSSGEGQVTFVSADAYTSSMRINTTVEGKAQTMTMETSGKFLGADCGSIKPLAVPKK
jgi:hypothetical protein